MGIDGNGLKPSSRRGATLPSTNRTIASIPRRRQTKKSFNNLKITVLCGLVTILVIRGTTDVGKLVDPAAVVDFAYDRNAVIDAGRLIREIWSDDHTDDDVGRVLQQLSSNASTSSAAAMAANFTMWPKISDWDSQRQRWLTENPEFPSQDAGGKPRILLVTGSPTAPCENAVADHYALKSVKNKIDYCRLHRIEILQIEEAQLDSELAGGGWAKLALIRRLMLAHPEFEWIWWMDSDALFTDMAFEVPLDRYRSHNLVINGYPDIILDQRVSSIGSFLLRNCQWSVDLLDAWASVGANGRRAPESGDKSALLFLLLSQQGSWGEKVFMESSYYLHGFWAGVVDEFENIMQRYSPGGGDGRWPFVTHFAGCDLCRGGGGGQDYPVEKCLRGIERAFNFADNQVLRFYGFAHWSMSSPTIRRIQNKTSKPLHT